MNEKVAFLELREQRLAEVRDDESSGSHDGEAYARRAQRMAERWLQHTLVCPVKPADQGRDVTLNRRVPKHDEPERGGDGERHQQRGEHGNSSPSK